MDASPRQIGPYTIERELGRGGMGVVHLAHDSRLDRWVALKALPDDMASDPEWLSRFQREARILAQLQHPNLAGLYGIEEHEGHQYLVLEYVEGETLAQRLDRGPLAIDETLELGAQIAAGVESAHEMGVVHRDLKPGNVIITPEGKAKVLDFGLAKTHEHGSSSSRHAQSLNPTLATPASPQSHTIPGAILGTAPYMSPEQARGRRVDKRTDVWSFGCILFECLTGASPFTGESATDTIGAILHKDVDLDALPEATPWRVRELLARMLERDREGRMRDLGDAMLELHAARRDGPTIARSEARSRRQALVSGCVLVLALGAAAGGWLLGRGRADDGAPGLRFTLTQLTDFKGIESHASLSPDGQTVVYASRRGGDSDIYSQRVGGFNATNLTPQSASDDSAPSFSPDGQRIAFHRLGAGAGIYIMGATGESPRRLTEFGADPSWSPDGRTIVFATEAFFSPLFRTTQSALWTVDVASGRTTRIFEGDAVQPKFSPSGERIAYWAIHEGGNRDIFTIASDGSDPVAVTSVSETDWGPTWSPDGQYLYFSSSRRGGKALWRVQVDQSTGEVRREPERVTTGATVAGAMPCFSRDGSRMAYTAVSFRHEIRRVDLNQDQTAIAGPPTALTSFTTNTAMPSISPDGTRIVYCSLGDRHEDLFLINADGTQRRRLTSDPSKDRGSLWALDGSEIYFYTDRRGDYEVWKIRPDGSGLAPSVLVDHGLDRLLDWSPDGSLALVALADHGHCAIARFSGDDVTEVVPLPAFDGADTVFAEDWSPDGSKVVCRAMANGLSRTVMVYDVGSGEYDVVLDTPVVSDVCFMPDSRRVLATLRYSMVIVDIDSGEQYELLREPSAQFIPTALALAPDGSFALYTVIVADSDLWMMKFDRGSS